MWHGITGAFLWICLLGLSHGFPKGGNRAQRSISESTALFMRDVYDVLRNQTGNIVISPFSIHLALAMTAVGARGNTASQLAKALHLNLDSHLLSGYRSILLGSKAEKSKGNEPDYKLDIANKMYVDKKFDIYNSYKTELQRYFLAKAESIDFSRSDLAQQTINNWIAEVTKNMIPSLIPQGSLNEGTRLVLANALYFKGTWLEKFDKENTFPEKFYTNGETIDADMMHMWTVKKAGMIPELDAKVLELPYKGRKYAMTILLPNQKDGLPLLEEKLASYNLDELFQHLRRRDVNIALPKFELEFSQQLPNVLNKLGVTDLFNYLSDLSGISNSSLLVSDIVHKAKIDVNEEGARAAAATGIIIVTKIADYNKPQPLTFTANHPFLFYIWDVEKKIYMFTGRVNNPVAAAVQQTTAHAQLGEHQPSQESQLLDLAQELELPLQTKLTTANEITKTGNSQQLTQNHEISVVGGHPVQRPFPKDSNGLYFPAPDPDHIVDYNCEHKEWENLPIHPTDPHAPQPKTPCHQVKEKVQKPTKQ